MVISHPSRRGKNEPLIDSITQGGKLISLDIEPLWVSTCAGCRRGLRSVNKSPDLLVSERQKFACELLSLQICASVALSFETGGKWPQNSPSQPVYTPSDVRAATSVELCMSKCATKMDGPNIPSPLGSKGVINRSL
ncbi:hypothetical protein ILYODFUR_039072 [Ilyodon furcidens]|uniref:Uncharacterized protein n=1 Tax=Ilyodon furcidens TaxID=33524 RepID=A0ABV0UG47_9TELE